MAKVLDFADYVIEITENLNTNRNHLRLLEQIEASSASIPQNIAEGKGRQTDKDFAKSLTYSRGSLYETITLLHLFFKRKWISIETLQEAEIKAAVIAKMINALLNKLRELGS